MATWAVLTTYPELQTVYVNFDQATKVVPSPEGTTFIYTSDGQITTVTDTPADIAAHIVPAPG